jgi:hypothetical protein
MVAATFVPVTTRKRQVADIIYCAPSSSSPAARGLSSAPLRAAHTITMISTLLLACLAASVRTRARLARDAC